jgi:hypothetical protein
MTEGNIKKEKLKINIFRVSKEKSKKWNRKMCEKLF